MKKNIQRTSNGHTYFYINAVISITAHAAFFQHNPSASPLCLMILAALLETFHSLCSSKTEKIPVGWDCPRKNNFTKVFRTGLVLYAQNTPAEWPQLHQLKCTQKNHQSGFKTHMTLVAYNFSLKLNKMLLGLVEKHCQNNLKSKQTFFSFKLSDFTKHVCFSSLLHYSQLWLLLQYLSAS